MVEHRPVKARVEVQSLSCQLIIRCENAPNKGYPQYHRYHFCRDTNCYYPISMDMDDIAFPILLRKGNNRLHYIPYNGECSVRNAYEGVFRVSYSHPLITIRPRTTGINILVYSFLFFLTVPIRLGIFGWLEDGIDI